MAEGAVATGEKPMTTTTTAIDRDTGADEDDEESWEDRRDHKERGGHGGGGGTTATATPTTPMMPTEEVVTRDTTCPFLLRMFCRESASGRAPPRPEDFAAVGSASGGKIPGASEFQVHTWYVGVVGVEWSGVGRTISHGSLSLSLCVRVRVCVCLCLDDHSVGVPVARSTIFRKDASLRELTALLQAVYPLTREPRVTLHFRRVFQNRSTGRWQVRPLGDVRSLTAAAANTANTNTNTTSSTTRNVKDDGAKTLQQTRFEIGDYLDVVIHHGHQTYGRR